MAENMFPPEVIELPSKGWFYSSTSPLSSGKVELKYMTAKEEDILTSVNLIAKGVVLDKLLEALILTPNINYKDIFTGDKDALFIAARIMGYGKEYNCTVTCPKCNKKSEQTIDLETIEDKKIDTKKFPKGVNEFSFTMPYSKTEITFRLLTHGDEKAIAREIEAMKKITKNGVDSEVTTRMKYAILSVDGDNEKTTVNAFVESLPARDGRAFREYAESIMPGIDFNFLFSCENCFADTLLEVPIDRNFFWPSN